MTRLHRGRASSNPRSRRNCRHLRAQPESFQIAMKASKAGSFTKQHNSYGRIGAQEIVSIRLPEATVLAQKELDLEFAGRWCRWKAGEDDLTQIKFDRGDAARYFLRPHPGAKFRAIFRALASLPQNHFAGRRSHKFQMCEMDLSSGRNHPPVGDPKPNPRLLTVQTAIAETSACSHHYKYLTRLNISQPNFNVRISTLTYIRFE